jgi:hypothetical protein
MEPACCFQRYLAGAQAEFSGMADCATERVFVLVIDGAPILAFQARSISEAQQLGREVWLLEDLKRMTSARVPLWDGKAPIRTRSARPDEAARYHRGHAEARQGDDDLPLVFLVEVDRHLEVAAPTPAGAFPPHR